MPHRPLTVFALILILECCGIWGRTAQTQEQEVQDGPVSVKHESVYQPGRLTIEPYDLGRLPSLPRNYQALNNRGYLVVYDGVVAGPHILRFNARSVIDQREFTNLRIFQARPDQFDPQSPVWVDVTELSSTQNGPDFVNKTLVARSPDLGVYVIAKLVGDPTKNPKADLAVSFTGISDTVRAPNSIPFTISVLNKGPEVATDVGLRSNLPSSSTFVRVEASQGKCKELMGSVYCKLGDLKPAETATVSFVVMADEGSDSFPEEGEVVASIARAGSTATDLNEDNDVATAVTRMLPNLNRAPIVSIQSPVQGDVYVGPTDITVKAIAEDPDGTINKVEFYDNGNFIGLGTPAAQKTFVIKTSNLSYGDHIFAAVVTDNQGRQNRAFVGGILVNGPARIKIFSPRNGASFAAKADLRLVATVRHPNGSPMKVEFRDLNADAVIGEGIRGPGDQYVLVWPNVKEGSYLIVVVATDAAGVPTRSQPLTFRIHSVVERPRP